MAQNFFWGEVGAEGSLATPIVMSLSLEDCGLLAKAGSAAISDRVRCFIVLHLVMLIAMRYLAVHA